MYSICLRDTIYIYIVAYEALPTEEPSTDNTKWYILGFTLGGVVVLGLCIWLALFIYCRCKRGGSKVRGKSPHHSSNGRGYGSESGLSDGYSKKETFRVR